MKSIMRFRLLLLFGLVVCAVLVVVMFPRHLDDAEMAVKAVGTEQSEAHGISESYVLFFGVKMCLPGYAPPECTGRLQPANDWYIEDCPNLEVPSGKTFDDSVATSQLGGRVGCDAFNGVDLVSPCAYLCYAHPSYGTAMVPRVVWEHAQTREGPWAQSMANEGYSDDRSADYFEGFSLYASVPRNLGPIKLIEVGAGPWTQTKGLLYQRPDIQVSDFTILEPAAQWYIDNVATCSYRTGKLQKFQSNDSYDFSVQFQAAGGEALFHDRLQYDALVAINVIEHVQNAFVFLSGLHHVLKPGGLLIFHERVYPDPLSADPVLGNAGFHPIRLPKNVFDVFFQQFDPIFSNFTSTSFMLWRGIGEKGYYFIGRKKGNNLMHKSNL